MPPTGLGIYDGVMVFCGNALQQHHKTLNKDKNLSVIVFVGLKQGRAENGPKIGKVHKSIGRLT